MNYNQPANFSRPTACPASCRTANALKSYFRATPMSASRALSISSANRKKLARVSATPRNGTINFYRVDTAYLC